MKQNSKSNYCPCCAYLIAAFTLIISFFCWTNVVTSWYIASVLNERGVVVVAEREVFPVVVEKLHAAAKEEESVFEKLSASLLNNRKEPNKGEAKEEKEASSSAEATEDKKEEKDEFAQWELRSAYTLSIPKIGVYTSVYLPSRRYWDNKEWTLLEEQMQVGLTAGAVAYPHSARPGAKGNLIIAGHSSPPDERAEQSGNGHLFAQLPTLEAGDTISVLAGESFVDYEVTKIAVVSPNDTYILSQQRDDRILKLITCYPIGSTRDRWIVTAVRVSSGSK